MSRRIPRHAALTAAALLAAPLLAVHAARGADPQPYTVELAATGNGALDQALRDSSNLLTLRESGPAGPFALVTRARDDAGRLMTALNSYGHYGAKVAIRIAGRDLDDPALPTLLERASAPVRVDVAIQPGPVFRLRRVALDGDVPPEGRAALRLEPGAPAVAADVLAAQARVLDALRRSGHALAKVDAPVAVLDPAAQALDVSYKVQAGPQVNLGPIGINGTERVDPAFVRRRLLVHPGERFDPDEIERARQDLASLGVFATVRARAAERLDAAGDLPLDFEVTERKRRAVGVTAAFSTDLGASVGVTWQHRNLFGQAEQLNLGAAVTQLGGSASRGQGYNVTAAFVKPDVWARNQNIQVNVQGIKESLDAYDRTAALAGATLSRKFSQVWTASVGVQGEQARILQQGVSQDYTLAQLPVGLRYDSTGTEGLFEPTHGIKAAATVTPTASLAGLSSNFTIVQLQGSTYFNLGAPGRSILALRGLVGTVQGANVFDLPPDQRLYAGGGGTVRGYKYQSIGPQFLDRRPTGGTYVAAATVEFRQRIGESFGAVVFADAGQVGTSGGVPPLLAGRIRGSGDSGVRAGAGVGARYYTAIGPIRVDLAVPLNKRPGDDAFEAYIGIGQAF